MPMDSTGILTLLGFAQKGKNLAAGEANVEAYLKKGKVSLLIIATDQSEKNQNKWKYLANEWGIESITFATKEELGRAIGMSPRGIVGITDNQMAQAILNKTLRD